MKHVKDNEVRKRDTDTTTYYVIGDSVRKQILATTDTLREIVELNHAPHKFNNNDKDALYTMDEVLKDNRDFNQNQWLKFGKMLAKFKLPDTLKELAKEFNWEVGKRLTREEMRDIMQERRDNEAKKKTELSDLTGVLMRTQNAAYTALFDES